MIRLAATALTGIALAGAAHADPTDVFGTFLTAAGTGHVTISDCGDGSPCGRISWIDPDSLPEGVTVETAETKAGDTVMGLMMLEGFERRKKDWRGGTIYDPENDKLYASRLKRLEDGSLQVKGCILMVCQTQVWTRVPGADG